MIKITFYLTIIVVFSVYSQIIKNPLNFENNKQIFNIVFNNKPPIILEKNFKKIIKFEEGIPEDSPGKPVLPYKTIFVALPPNGELSVEFQESNFVTYSNVEPELSKTIEYEQDRLIYKDSEPDLKYYQSDSYPNKDYEIIGYTWIRNFYCAILNIYTHRYYWKKREVTEMVSSNIIFTFYTKEPYMFTRLESEYDKEIGSVIFNYEYAQNFKSNPVLYSLNDTTGNWIDYNKTYVKLGIPDDGIYKITYNNLIEYGINPSNINTKTLKIHYKGSQIPLRVIGEDDLIFDQHDYIEFYATKNYGSSDYRTIVSFGQAYKNFMNRYTDTSIVYLSWGGEDGIRFPIFDGNTLTSNDSLTSHKAFIHLEKDVRLWYYDNVTTRVNLPQWQENKVWTWYTLSRGGTLNISFSATNVVPNSVLKSYVRMISYASNISTNAHKIGIGFNNNNVLDSISFNFKQTANLFSTLNSNVLINGSNQLRLFGLQTSASFYQVLIDWAEIEYLRYNYMVNDSIYLLINDDVSTSVRAVKIYGVNGTADDFLIYKIGDNKKIIDNFILTNNQIVFFDSVSAGEKYFIIKKTKTKTPVFYYIKQFENLRSDQNSADYIIISNRILETGAQSYINFVHQNYNLRTKLVFVNDIYDEFGYGNPEAEAIQRFLKKAYDSWVSPPPSYLLLLGDANYDYKDVVTDLAFRRKNLVPSFGQPVSDAWYVLWDIQNPLIPQMSVARIPARNNDEIFHYLIKHQSYIQKPYDDWNKKILLFSGGDPNKLSELLEIRNKHNQLYNNVVYPSPFGGFGWHFYKTVNPNSNFGPFSPEFVQNAIDTGAVIISYIGHSGTQTWDNGITNVRDLKNLSSDKKPFISDFGCSTGRFAEPDIECFGEMFINSSVDGQAIGYAGNSSFGYLSTSLRFPELFYSQFIQNNNKKFGSAHNLAKVNQINLFGTGEVNRVFTYCNILFGDPLITLRTPDKPNFKVNNESLRLSNNFPVDLDDSLNVRIKFFNFGLSNTDSLTIRVVDFHNDSVNFQSEFRIQMPRFEYEYLVNIPIKNKAGNHNLQLIVDILDEIEEIYENDNSLSINYQVYSAAVIPIEKEKYYISKKDSLIILNPSLKLDETSEQYIIQFSDNPEFNYYEDYFIDFDTLYTVINIPQLNFNPRIYWRIKVNNPNSSWSEVYSFNSYKSEYEWIVDSTFRPNDIETQNAIFNGINKAWEISNKVNSLKIRSAGSTAGSFASFLYNGEQALTNTFFWGIVTALIDTVTLQPYNVRYFVFPNPPSGDSLKAYVDNLPPGTVIAMAVCDDAAQSVLGFSGGTPVRRSIETLGSVYIDSVRYRESWCIIGVKGAPTGSVPEDYKKRFEGVAEIEISKTSLNDTGKVIFPVIKNSNAWKKLKRSINQPTETNIEFTPLGIREGGTIDTLSILTFVGDSTDISAIDANIYSQIKVLARLIRNQNYETPSINNLSVNYSSYPELALNYQTMKINKDTVEFNDSIKIDFGFTNVGESSADSFKVKLAIKKSDNTERILYDSLFSSFDQFERFNKVFYYKNDTTEGTGQLFFRAILDYENRIKEFSELNNSITIPFVAKPDTNTTSIKLASLNKVLFDDNYIYDGDYTSNNPEIKIEISYGSQFPYYDTTAIKFYLDNKIINYNQMKIDNDSANRKLIFTISPLLQDGEHVLSIYGDDLINRVNNSSRYNLVFYVSSNVALIDLYNYPNPFKEKTYFTFKLPQLPDELRIKIFTIAGRVIKEISVNPAQLSNNFNRIEWDGKDEDGNQVANGVYFYKAIIKKGDKVNSFIQKLAILK